MEPITVISSAVLSQLQTSAVVETIVSSFIGSRADNLICSSTKHLFNKIKNNLEEPANHDIQKAVRKAYLNATFIASENVKRDKDLIEIRRYIKSELILIDKPNTKFPKSELNENFEQLLSSKKTSVEERLPEIIKALKDSLFYELKLMRLRPPLEFKNAIYNGWKEKNKNFDWYQLICAFASEEFKANNRIRAIIQTDYLSVLNTLSSDINIKIDSIIKLLEEFYNTYKPYIEKLDELLEISKRTENKIDRIDEKVDFLVEKYRNEKQLNSIPSFDIDGLKASKNYKNIKAELKKFYKKEEQIKLEIEDYQIEVKEATNKTLERKQRLLRKAELNQLDTNKKRLELEKVLEVFVSDVLTLAKILEDKGFEENSKLKTITKLFNQGKYTEVNKILNENYLYKELNKAVIKQKELSQKFSVKAQTVVIEKCKNWFSLANKYYLESISIYESDETLFQFAFFLAEHGKTNKAIKFYQKSLKIRRNLASGNKRSELSNLSDTLNNLANLQKQNKKYEIAKKLYKEALIIRKELNSKFPDNYSVKVAETLNNLALLQDYNQEREVAKKNYNEALTIFKKLSNSNFNLYAIKVAQTLNNMGILYRNNNEFKTAEEKFNMAVDIIDKLSCDNKNMFLTFKAQILNNLAIMQCINKDYDIAKQNYIKALKIFKDSSVKNPYKYLRLLSDTLNNFANLQNEQKDVKNARKNYIKSIEILKKLVIENPSQHSSNLADTLNNLAELECNNKNFGNAEKHFNEGNRIYKELANVNPKRYGIFYANSSINIAIYYKNRKLNKKKSLDHIEVTENFINSYKKTVNWPKELITKVEKIKLYWKNN